jgi:methylated-DNA-[protein]-cysteine S-methyltransferase
MPRGWLPHSPVPERPLARPAAPTRLPELGCPSSAVRAAGTARQGPVGPSGQDGSVPRHAVIPSPIGDLTLVVDEGAVTHLLMGDPGGDVGPRDDQALPAARQQLDEYFAGERREFDLPLAPRGDDFKQRVWALLREIPYGETRSYGDLARALGDVSLSQAVGTANARNPISIVVPCHRVIGSDGSLTGYAGGLDRKRFLLALEETDEQRAGRLF